MNQILITVFSIFYRNNVDIAALFQRQHQHHKSRFNQCCFDFFNKTNADMQQLQCLLKHLVKMSLLIFY